MTVRIPAGGLVMAACGALVVALTACGSSTPSPTASSGTASSETVEVPAPPPSAEPSGPEQPQQPKAQLAVDLASLPVGGQQPLTKNPTCADVSWGSKSIPEGVRIKITRVKVNGDNGDDVHEAPGVSCQPPCHDYVFAADTGGCQVAVGWTPNSPPKTLTGTIGLDGQCIAPDQPTCDQMKATLASEGGRVQVFVPAKNASSASSEPPPSEPPPSSEPSANGGS